jgi:hypothetical protein
MDFNHYTLWLLCYVVVFIRGEFNVLSAQNRAAEYKIKKLVIYSFTDCIRS